MKVGVRSTMVLQESVTVQAGVCSSGVDLGDVQRYRLAVERSGQRFNRRVFGESTPTADGELPRDVAMTAAFSMKESVIKAAGGLPRGGRYTDIEFEARRRGPLSVRLSGALGEWARRQGVRVVADHVMLADDVVLSWAVALDPGGRR